MMISSSIMIEKQAMKIEKYSHKKSRFCLIQKKLDISCPFPDDLFEGAFYLFNLFLIFVLFRVILLHKAYPFFCPSAEGFFEIL